jgi:hypothetical protein
MKIVMVTLGCTPDLVVAWQVRKRDVVLHFGAAGGASDISGASVRVMQMDSSLPFGACINTTVIQNPAFVGFFTKHFDWAVFENELKWYHTEAQQGQLNYADADALLDFCDRYGKPARGHCIFWAVENTVQQWVKALDADGLRAAVQRRLQSLLTRYAGRFPHYDVNNEMLHGSFYRDRLGDDVDAFMFRETARLDPGATLFVNDYNVEGGADPNATPEKYIEQISARQARHHRPRGGNPVRRARQARHHRPPRLAHRARRVRVRRRPPRRRPRGGASGGVHVAQGRLSHQCRRHRQRRR